MLAEEHVHAIRTHLQSHANFPLRLSDLEEESNGRYLDHCLVQATGGAPRLLLYALRALHVLKLPLGSVKLIKEAVFERTYEALKEIAIVSQEFLPSKDNDSTMKNFQMLLAFAIQKTKIGVSTAVQVGNKPNTENVARMLRFQPFFLSRDGCTGKKFVLHLPTFHMRAAEEKFGAHALPMLLLSMAGIVAHVVEPWRIFELLAAHLVATIAAMKLAINDGGSDLTWADALPELLGASAIGKKTKFDLGLEPYRLTRVHGKCPDLLEEDPERFMGNGALSPADKSNSADVFHLQRMMSGEGHVVIQSQPKLWVISQVTMSTCRDEVGKSTKRMQSILIIYAATIGSQLIKAMANDVLVLRSWDKSTQAMFVFSVDNVLLWRPVVLEAANAGPDATYENKKA